MDLEAAIQAQTKDTPPEQITELVLDTCKATKVSGLEKFSNLKSLTLNGCGLATLDGFPQLPELRRLELSDNVLSDGLEMLQDAALFQLRSLSLAGNKFSTLEDLEPLGSLPSLKDLDLFNCAVTEVENYRQGVFDMLPNLKYLDGFDVDDNEKEDDDEDDEDGDIDDDDDDLLDSEGGGEEDSELGEEEFGEDGDSNFDDGEEDSEVGEDGEEGDSEVGEDGEEDFDEDGDGEEDSEVAHDSKRRKT